MKMLTTFFFKNKKERERNTKKKSKRCCFMHGSVSCHPGDVRGFRTDIKRNEATFSNFVIRAQKETKTITAFFARSGRTFASCGVASA